jgi:hypothetical protein
VVVDGLDLGAAGHCAPILAGAGGTGAREQAASVAGR